MATDLASVSTSQSSADLEGGLLVLIGLLAEGFQEGGVQVDGALVVGEAGLVEDVADGSGPRAAGLGVEENFVWGVGLAHLHRVREGRATQAAGP